MAGLLKHGNVQSVNLKVDIFRRKNQKKLFELKSGHLGLVDLIKFPDTLCSKISLSNIFKHILHPPIGPILED